jgi:hypothetical protein
MTRHDRAGIVKHQWLNRFTTLAGFHRDTDRGPRRRFLLCYAIAII